MKQKKEKTDAEDRTYFWDRIRQQTLEKWILGLILMLVCTPILASLAVRPWIYMLRGEVGVRFCSALTIGQCWHTLIYLLSAAITACVFLIILQSRDPHLLSRCREKDWILSHMLELSFTLMLLWSVLSTLFAQDRKMALWGINFYHEGLVSYFFYGAIFLGASGMDKKQMRITAEVLAGACAFTGVLEIFRETPVSELFYLEQYGTAMFSKAQHYGSFLAVGGAVAMGLWLQDPGRNLFLKALRLAELWLVFNAISVNGTFAGLLGTAAAMTNLGIYVFRQKKSFRKRFLFLTVLFLLTLLAVHTGTSLSQNTGDQSGETLDPLVWSCGLQLAAKRPLLGVGPGNIQGIYREILKRPEAPHSDLLLIAVSLGIPALIVYLAGIAAHIMGFIRFEKNMSILEMTMYAATGAYMLISFFSESAYDITIYYILMLGLSCGVYRRQCRKKAETV